MFFSIVELEISNREVISEIFINSVENKLEIRTEIILDNAELIMSNELKRFFCRE